MNIKEFHKHISESSNKEWLNEIEESFNFSYINLKYTLKGISAIYDFIVQQDTGWNSYGDSIPNELKQSKAYFDNIKNRIVDFINNYANSPQDSYNLTNYWSNIRNYIYQTQNLYPLTFDCPEIDFLFKLYKESPNYCSGAFQFITSSSNFNSNSKDNLVGYLMAYEYTFKDKTNITERRDTEKKSLSTIRAESQKYLSESSTQLVNHLSESTQKYEEYISKIDNFKTEKEKIINDWYLRTQQDFSDFSSEAGNKIKELELTYQEKLKFEEPAKYWADRALMLKTQGWNTLWILVGLILLSCTFLGVILWKAPEEMFKSFLGADKSAAIRWSIVFITLISLMIFGIRSVHKIMFSSFHLARDCEERHTLTYFYLSLLKDSKVDEKDRQLIMQSLFSRAETGLLKDDSSPTMPATDIAGKIFGKGD